MKLRFYSFYLFTVLLSVSCSTSSEKKNEESENPLKEFRFEVADSIMVDALEVLVALDYNPANGHYLFKQQREGKVYVVDSQGEILQTAELGGEGPNQAGTFMEGQFWGKEGYIFKEFSATMDFHLYDLDFQKVKVQKGAAVGINALSINYFKQTFDCFMLDGIPYLIGEEINGYEGGEIDGSKIGASFYDKATSGFLINLQSEDSVQRINLFAKDWKPKLEGKWIGNSLPSVAYDPASQTAFVLPSKGNQLSYFKVSADGLEFQKSIELNHPDRNESVAKADQDQLTYPGFDDIKNLGEYQLISFNTAVPEDILSGIKAKAGDQYYNDPEFKQALKLYRKSRYILIKDGKQVGIINGAPEEGNINLGLPDGTLLIKAADGEEERDYNLFYRMKLVEE